MVDSEENNLEEDMKAWEEFIAAQEKDLGSETVSRWLKPLKVIHFDAGNLYLEAVHEFQLAWFEEHMRAKVQKFLLNNNHRPVKVHLSFQEGLRKKKEDKKNTPWKPILKLSSDSVDPKSTFESYLSKEKGASVLLQEALKNPSSFNPIYIYGPKESGKTHLLMAAAHLLRSKKLSCFYVHAETLTEHVVAAIRSSAMQKFREIYRNHDALIIDDIDVIGGRSASQEEFFHTFNTLHMAGKQIILSAKVPPSHLTAIEPRLTSRFEWGLVLSLEKLSSEELKHLLYRQMQTLQFSLPQTTQEFLFAHFNSPTSLLRSLDALILRAHLDHLNPSQIDSSKATIFLTKLLEQEKKDRLTPNKIIDTIAEIYRISPNDILSKIQTKELMIPRKIAMYLCRTLLKLSFPKIGAIFFRDHSTVMTSIKDIEGNPPQILGEVQRKLKS